MVSGFRDDDGRVIHAEALNLTLSLTLTPSLALILILTLTLTLDLNPEAFPVHQIPKLASEHSASLCQQPWDDAVCLNFLHDVLSWLRSHVHDETSRALCYCGREKSDELLLVPAPALPQQALPPALLATFDRAAAGE